MNSKNLLNLKVNHKVFGMGIITSISDNYMTIKFATKESKFVYPNAFEKFIVADDALIQAKIVEEINNIKLVAEAKRQAAETACKNEEDCHVAERRATPAIRNKRSIEEGFDSDYHVKHLAKQPILTYQQVEK